VVLVALWLATGLFYVQPDEMGVVTFFGAYARTAHTGLNYHLPWPVEAVELPSVTRVNRIEIGYRSGQPGEAAVQTGRDSQGADVLEESLMLTGDENIVDIDFAVLWTVRDPVAFLFNVRTPADNPAAVIKAVAESAMREVVGRTPIQDAWGSRRAQIELDVLNESQAILDSYGAGVTITQVQLQKVDPPAAVVDSFRDVQRATTEAQSMRNEAEGYHNDIVPRARGDAAQVVAQAEGQRQAFIADATGETQRFLQVLGAYRAAPDITRRRVYIETMQEIMTRTPSTIIDPALKGIVPLLRLDSAPANAPPGASVGEHKP
jgi:membrane protease subunit HflK